MTTPLISVVMANYNCAAFVGAAIHSVRQQTFADWELVLVDDASLDDSVAVAQAAAGGDPRVRIVEQPRNGGAARARNRALDLARGRWVAVVDSDDLMAPARLQRLLDHAQANGAEIVADNQILYSPEGSTLFIPPDKARRLSSVSLAAFIRSNCLYADLPSLGYLKPLIHRDAIGALRYAEDLRNGEDYDLVARIMARGARLSVLPEALYTYRIHPNSVSRTLTEGDLEGLLAANQALVTEHAPLERQLAEAVARRRRTLQALLDFTRVINALKGRRVGQALALALTKPGAWLLFSRPVKARLRRVGHAVRARLQRPRLAVDVPLRVDGPRP